MRLVIRDSRQMTRAAAKKQLAEEELSDVRTNVSDAIFEEAEACRIRTSISNEDDMYDLKDDMDWYIRVLLKVDAARSVKQIKKELLRYFEPTWVNDVTQNCKDTVLIRRKRRCNRKV